MLHFFQTNGSNPLYQPLCIVISWHVVKSLYFFPKKYLYVNLDHPTTKNPCDGLCPILLHSGACFQTMVATEFHNCPHCAFSWTVKALGMPCCSADIVANSWVIDDHQSRDEQRSRNCRAGSCSNSNQKCKWPYGPGSIYCRNNNLISMWWHTGL